jgi:hypothetical protein
MIGEVAYEGFEVEDEETDMADTRQGAGQLGSSDQVMA